MVLALRANVCLSGIHWQTLLRNTLPPRSPRFDGDIKQHEKFQRLVNRTNSYCWLVQYAQWTFFPNRFQDLDCEENP